MKKPIFKDQQLQQQFDKLGYAKFRLLDDEDVHHLREKLNHYFPEGLNAFFSSSYLEDFQLKSQISNQITEILKHKIGEHFTNARSIGSAFLIKGMGKHSEMPMHQDWTIVDESKYYAVNIWIPLTTTNEANGTIEVLEGSHNWNRALRAPTLPFFFDGLQEQIKPALTQICAEPGEVVVLNQAVVHYSKPNLTNENRPAITSGLVSADASLIFHYWDKEREEIEVIAQKDDFLLRFENFHEAIYKRPLTGESLGFKAYDHPKMTIDELYDFIGKPEQLQSKKGFFSRLFGN